MNKSRIFNTESLKLIIPTLLTMILAVIIKLTTGSDVTMLIAETLIVILIGMIFMGYIERKTAAKSENEVKEDV